MERGSWHELELPVTPEAPSRARRWLAGQGEPLVGTKLELVQLLVTELVTNSFRHGIPEAEAAMVMVRAHLSVERLRIEVVDQGVSFTAPARPELPDGSHAGGRGLYILDRLADWWGVHPEPPTRVWFEMRKREAPGLAY